MTQYGRPSIVDGQVRVNLISLGELNKKKQEAQQRLAKEKERKRLIQIMYGREDIRRERLEAEHLELEIMQMRQSLGLEPGARGWATKHLEVHEMAKDEMEDRRKEKDKVNKMALRQMRRKKA